MNYNMRTPHNSNPMISTPNNVHIQHRSQPPSSPRGPVPPPSSVAMQQRSQMSPGGPPQHLPPQQHVMSSAPPTQHVMNQQPPPALNNGWVIASRLIPPIYKLLFHFFKGLFHSIVLNINLSIFPMYIHMSSPTAHKLTDCQISYSQHQKHAWVLITLKSFTQSSKFLHNIRHTLWVVISRFNQISWFLFTTYNFLFTHI